MVSGHGAPLAGPSAGIEHRMGQVAAPRWRIVVVDDHAPSRSLVLSTVAALGGALVAESVTAAGTMELLERVRPDAVVLAVGLPGVGEAEAFAMLRKAAMDRRVTIAAVADELIKGGATLDRHRKR